jgi:hypothetical protein
VHSFAKLVTKILANRLAPHMDKLVSTNQSAFIKGRFIQDNFMMVQQTARFLHAQKQPRILLKLDISKASGSVSWAFLLDILEHMGFGRGWRDIIAGLLSTSSTQILLNGVPRDFINHQRGLRQGDPFSPMLFIIVMDALNLLISKAAESGLLQPLSSRSIQHRVSLYADDVVLFVRPSESDIALTTRKSSVVPIQCGDDEIASLNSLLPCRMENFSINYLGLPLSIHKLKKAQLQPLIDRLAALLPGWRADLMTRAGRAVHVQFVITATAIYQDMALDLPPWFIKAVDKIRCGYLWKGRLDAKGGHCLVAWPKVTRAKELGGLGIADLQMLNWALRVRWLWLKKTDTSKPWASFQLPTSRVLQEFFSMSLTSEVGDGCTTLFWKDRWLCGHRISELAPRLSSLVPTKIINKKTVAEALPDLRWTQDLHGVLSESVVSNLLNLADLLSEVTLQQDQLDRHVWRLSMSGKYSTKSAYEASFQGSISFEAYDHIWKSWAPPKCAFFLWLVAHNRCWTADKIQHRNLPHLDCCLLCDQEKESIGHLLVRCVFARQFWYYLLRRVGLAALAPYPAELSFMEWWWRMSNSISNATAKGFNSGYPRRLDVVAAQECLPV